ncbi:MAG: protein translocase subunit SecF [Acidimicrobiia bacterium]|nr:protein translocase subunit SecF [Acidimicrobiia bacterium]
MNGLRRILRSENDIDFVRLWRVASLISAALVVISIAVTLLAGLVRGIEFRGGTAWEVPSGELSVSEARDVLRPLGLGSARIQTVGAETLRVQAIESDPGETDQVRGALAEAAGVAAADIAVTEVGPSWGSQISSKALRALLFFFVAVGIYITLALREWRMAVGAVVAVVHDIILSVGLYAVFRLEVTPATVIAFLTVLGYSLYDTVVVFDRIKENTPKVALGQRLTYTDMANLSANQVLLRSLNTTVTTLLPIVSILVVGALILGATTLKEFGLALVIGLLAGTYSSIFIATPVLAWLKEREPQYREIRERLARRDGTESSRRGAAPQRARAGALGDVEPDDEPAGAVVRASAAASRAAASPGPADGEAREIRFSGNAPPRPRKNRRN